VFGVSDILQLFVVLVFVAFFLFCIASIVVLMFGVCDILQLFVVLVFVAFFYFVLLPLLLGMFDVTADGRMMTQTCIKQCQQVYSDPLNY
jgi:hypothetical protein